MFRNLSAQRSTQLLWWSGGILTLLYVLLSGGVYHPDEHFQILEYAHMRLFGTPAPEELPWEYGLQMRPGLQPWIAYKVMQGLEYWGCYTPRLTVTLLHLLAGALSLLSLAYFSRSIRSWWRTPQEAQGFLILSLFLWFMAYLRIRFSSEVFSGSLLLCLIAAVLRYQTLATPRNFAWGVWFGLLAGMAFITRYQVGFALLGFGVWLLWNYPRRVTLFLGLLLGLLALLGVGMAADHWLYGTWTVTPINYLRENILNGHIDSFGVDPWYYYLWAIPAEGGILFGVATLAATIWFCYHHPRNVITWMVVVFLLAHQCVGHKEVRFLFPVVVLTPFFLTLWMREWPQSLWKRRAVRIGVGLLVVINTLLILFHLGVRNTDIAFYRMMERYCTAYPQVAALHLIQDKTYYSYYEQTLTPRLVAGAFYLPSNLQRESYDSLGALEQAAQALHNHGTEVLILSEDPKLPEHMTLKIKAIPWNPYPQWVARYFNFNDWVGLSVRRKNLYRLEE